MSNLYDEITQVELNTVICRMIDFIKLETPLNLLNDLTNSYCNLVFELDDPTLISKNNTISGDEIIVSNAVNLKLSNPSFTSLDYYIQLNYYKLDADINDDMDNQVIREEFQLFEGDNVISFDDYPIYLQSEFDLLIRKGDE